MLIAFLAAAGLQLFFWSYYLRDGLKKESALAPESQPPAPVSVIVCFRNEETTLEACLRSLLNQEFAGVFEVLAIDDNSTDSSAAVVAGIAAQDTRVRLLTPGPTRPGKKDALTFGIKNARYEHLLLTDADCTAATDKWLNLMTKPLRQGAEVVLGIGLYTSDPHNELSVWQSFEAKYVLLKYMGFARRGLPYMGVGRNLAYTKTFFHHAGGLEAHADLPGGDDDLLIGGAALPEATVRVTHPHSITKSAPATTRSEFLRQRMRHQSVGFRYRLVHQVLLGLLALSHGLFFLLGFLLLFTPWWWLALGIYGLRYLLIRPVFRQVYPVGAPAGAGKGLEEQALPVGRHMIFDAMLAPFYLFLAVAGAMPAKRW
ncbi:glycosyltransferase [Neolewinella persica]|uniref:glycosyltransferase n=1 Tax=Neolewinella persica TaxID=70998 RepID=UPI00036B4C49|nr:glycosyltransferase [Neolewinella persica]